MLKNIILGCCFVAGMVLTGYGALLVYPRTVEASCNVDPHCTLCLEDTFCVQDPDCIGLCLGTPDCCQKEAGFCDSGLFKLRKRCCICGYCVSHIGCSYPC